MFKKFLLFAIVLFSSLTTQAAVSITASAPEVVAVGEQFRLEYTVNSQSVKSIQNITKIPGFDILYGPSRSSYNSVQIINGHKTSNSAVTYSYLLSATKTGDYTMPRLSAVVDGHNVTSNTVRIHVVASAGGNASSGRGNGSGQSSSGNNSPVSSQSRYGKISNKDLFITVTAGKKEVYEQEPVLLTYRVYARVNLTQLAGKMPDLKGFMTKEIPLPQQKSFSIGNYNGQNYYTTVWSQYVMFPQQTGKLTIPNIKFEGVVEFPDLSEDPLDAFFNGTSGSLKQKKTIVAPSLDILVKPLPAKPADFSGAVGRFNIKSVLKTPHPKENETLNLELIIEGTGNVDLIKAPKVKFPSDFETYDPKQNANSKLTASGLTGAMVVDYIAVPHKKGKYTIPPIEFTYFDTSTNAYKTIRTAPIEVNVAKGEKNIYSDKQQELLARSDIRYINKDTVKLHHKEDLFWNKTRFWLYYLVLFMLFIVVYALLRRRAVLRGDVVGRRIRGAGRLSMARLRKAKKLMSQNKVDEFYEETLSALLGYVSDRLSIPVSELTKERIRDEFRIEKVDENLSANFLALLDTCEFHRYSQSKAENESLQSVYNRAIEMITTLNGQLKKRKKK